MPYSLKDCNAICYNGGAYGTYLEWVLSTLSCHDPVVDPFTEQGNSHKFIGNLKQLLDCPNYKDSFSSNYPWIRTHPKIKKTDSIGENLQSILEHVKQVVYIYPDSDSILLNLNNYYDKIWVNWWEYQFNEEILPSKIYDNWPVDPLTPIDQVPTWIQREFLSYYLMPAWYDQVEWNHLDHWQHKQCLPVLIKDLLYNFEQTIATIKEFTKVEFARPIQDMLASHNKMLSLQKFINQDQICNQIINSVVSNKQFDWGDQLLPLPSEAWIQWQLRNLGYEIRCHGLDIFPTNSVHLQKLIYKI